MDNKIKTAGIFCASSPRIDKKYFSAADDIARILVKDNIAIYFGGGKYGLMGQVAERVKMNNGKITGVIPSFMKAENWHNEDIRDMIVVKSMHERKEKILNTSDILVALPGGCGTVEELMEAITWKQLGLYTGPIIILNINGFYSPLLKLLEKMISENFLREVHRKIWSVIEKPSDLMDAVKNTYPWSVDARSFAAVK